VEKRELKLSTTEVVRRRRVEIGGALQKAKDPGSNTGELGTIPALVALLHESFVIFTTKD
jgi:hypothetical protein